MSSCLTFGKITLFAKDSFMKKNTTAVGKDYVTTAGFSVTFFAVSKFHCFIIYESFNNKSFVS